MALLHHGHTSRSHTAPTAHLISDGWGYVGRVSEGPGCQLYHTHNVRVPCPSPFVCTSIRLTVSPGTTNVSCPPNYQPIGAKKVHIVELEQEGFSHIRASRPS